MQDSDKELITTALAKIPEGIGYEGLFCVKKIESKGRDAVIFSFHGSRFNRILSLLLGYCLDKKARVRYNDFVVKIEYPGKDGAWDKTITAMSRIREMNEDEMGTVLPLPAMDSWKFVCALPDSLVREMVRSDYYHLEDFVEDLREMNFIFRETSP